MKRETKKEIKDWIRGLLEEFEDDIETPELLASMIKGKRLFTRTYVTIFCDGLDTVLGAIIERNLFESGEFESKDLDEYLEDHAWVQREVNRLKKVLGLK